MVKPFFIEGYCYEATKDGHIFKVVRAGLPKSFYDRGGTWYEVELWRGYETPYAKGMYPHVGGSTVHRKVIILKKPYFFQIPEIKAEGEIPIKLWEHVMGQKLPSKRGLFGMNAEKVYAKLEKQIAQKLKREGYDGVVLYYQVGKTIETRYPKELFVFD